MDNCYEDLNCAVAAYMSQCILFYHGDILKLIKGTAGNGWKISKVSPIDFCASIVFPGESRYE